MHSLAAYSLRADIAPTDSEVRLRAIDAFIDEWLVKKEAADPRATHGSFESLTGGGEGRFTRTLTESSAGNLRDVELIETAHTGQIFTTTIQTAYDGKAVSVFATLSVTSVSGFVAPVAIYPRCPWVIRSLIDSFGDWTLGGQQVPNSTPMDAQGEKEALQLCSDIRSPDRNLPLIVVSIDADEVVWTDLPREMARHLVGLANVAFVAEAASWVMTDELGKQDSCYLGAVRLYWPGTSAPEGLLRSTTWTVARLLSFGDDRSGMLRFLSVMRRSVMAAAALTLGPPKVIRDIQTAASRDRLQAMEAGIRDKELDAIVEENAGLVNKLEEANRTIASLQWKISYLRDREGTEADNDAQGDGAIAGEAQPTHVTAADGELRYYKKIGTRGGVDTLVVTGACNHKSSAWTPAFKGVQAEKGLEKLEGRTDWQSIAHCGGCTGGGRWRVQW